MDTLDNAFEQHTTLSGTSATAPKKELKRLLTTCSAILLVVAIVVFVAGCKRAVSEQAAYITEPVKTRNIVKALKGSGTLKPAKIFTVITQASGEVISDNFEEGDTVKKGEVLFAVNNSSVTNSIEQAERSFEQSQLTVEQSLHALEKSKRTYNETVNTQYVYASDSGVIVSYNFYVGDRVTAGQTIATIRDSSKMLLKVPFPSDDVSEFEVGQNAIVVLDSTFETLSGIVREISNNVEVGTGNVLTRKVTIEVANPGALDDQKSASASVSGINSSDSATFAYLTDRTVTAEATGTINKIIAHEGDRVEKGEIILTLGGGVDNAIKSAEDSVKDAADALKSSELSMEKSRLTLENTRSILDDYTIKSPINGTIVNKQYCIGDMVQTGMQVCTIYDLSYMEMTLNIDELDICDISFGQSVAITADAVAGKSYEGFVTKASIVGTITGTTTSYPVTIMIKDSNGLLPSMHADAEILIAESNNALSIPNAAVERGGIVLITSDSPSAVNALPLQAPEGFAYVLVVTGICDDNYVEILSGLTEKDVIAYIPQSVESTDSFSALEQDFNNRASG